MGHPAFYQIRVQEELDHSWSDWLGGLSIVPQANGETVLTGPVIDQAALHGVLDKLLAMNLSIISISRVEKDTQVHE